MSISFRELVEFDQSIPSPDFAPYLPSGLAAVGLLLTLPPEFSGYANTPKNALTFARFGFDGIHVSFLTNGNANLEECVCALTIPMAGLIDKPHNYILARNLTEFMGLGCHAPFDLLGSLHLNFEEVVAQLESGISASHHPWPEYKAFCNGVRAQLVATFGLKPIRDIAGHLRQLNPGVEF